MNLSKAIKKQRKNYILFLVFASFTFVLLPLILIILNNYHIAIWIYLCIVESFIVFSVIRRIEAETLCFKHEIDRFYIKNSIFKRHIYFKCDILVFVHLEKSEEEENLILLFQSKRFNRGLRNINKNFMRKHVYAASYYYNLYKLKPECYYYYMVINKGKNKKYALLNELYSSCFNAFYSKEAIDIIKKCRE